MKDYYKILEVNSSASEETISKVYKFLAKKWHPDANPDNTLEAEEKFKEISEAYEVLSNSDRRSQYDKELQDNHDSNFIDINSFLELQDYCKQLEKQISLHSTQTQSSSSTNNAYTQTTLQNDNHENYQNLQQAYQNAQQQAYQDAMNKAYIDNYYNTLRNMGYKIKYKKTLKDHFKNFLSLVISFVIILFIAYILFHIPFFRNYINNLFIF